MVFFASPLAAQAVTPELHGYMRAGTGTNGKGGKMECIDNQGIPSNPMRLGNECSLYGETALTAPLLQGKTDSDPFFLSSVRMAWAPPGNQDFEGGTLEGPDKRDLNIVEAFVEGGKFEGSPITYWAGKRFYRDVDVYIDDWYYWAEMSGNGGGFGNLPLLGGTFSVAALLQTGSTLTSVGMNQAQVLDFRLMQVPLSERDQINFWGALGQAPGGKDSQGREYVARGGWLFGARWRHNLWEGFNDLSITHGERLMESLSLYGNAAVLQSDENAPGHAERWRVVNNMNVQPSAHFGLHGAVAFEYFDPHAASDQSGHFLTVAARPIWYITPHYQIDFEMGHTLIQKKNDADDNGNPIGARHLTRFTIAPSVAVDSKLWARPVIRVFYSYSFWNRANMGNQYIGKDAPSLAAATSGHNIGIQTEVWF